MTLEEFAAIPKMFVGTKEVAELLGTSRWGLSLAAKDGKLSFDYFFSGNRLKISKASVLKFCGYEMPLNGANAPKGTVGTSVPSGVDAPLLTSNN